MITVPPEVECFYARNSKGRLYAYGQVWPKKFTILDVELFCFREYMHPQTDGFTRDPERAAEHFKNVAAIIAPDFVWHPWAEKMLIEHCRWSLLGVCGCASSGKSDFDALWAIINFLAAPTITTVLITTTTVGASEGRIWGSVEKRWKALPEGMPGRLIASKYKIVYEDPAGTPPDDNSPGIFLIAGSKGSGVGADNKLLGRKGCRMILIADELPELSPMITSAIGNLRSNPNFQCIGIGNPSSIYDPHGWFCEPEGGWDKISYLDYEWPTRHGGYCIRFDGYRSPNVEAGHVIYPFLIRQETLDENIQMFGKDSVADWRMNKGFWCPEGSQDGVYSGPEFVQNGCDKTNDFAWKGKPALLATLDPSFTSGGDRSMMYVAEFGEAASGRTILQFREHKLLAEDVRRKDVPVPQQIAEQFRDECKKLGIPPQNAAYDMTGGGGPFGAILVMVWSPLVNGINFGGKATDYVVDPKYGTRAFERYKNRMSEIWFQAKEYVRSGQIKGIVAELGAELTSRKYSTKKDGSKKMIEVESKKIYKARTGHSPDLADAALMLVDFARKKFGFKPLKKNETSKSQASRRSAWMKKMDVVTRSGNFLR